MMKEFRFRFLLAGLFVCLLALSPAVHSYFHPHEVSQTSTCPTTGFALTLDCPESGPHLPAYSDAAEQLIPPRQDRAHSLFQASILSTRGPPVSLLA